MELLEGGGELLLPAIIELERPLGGLGSKKDGLGDCGVDIVIEEALLVRPERNTVYDFALHTLYLGRLTLNFYALMF